MAKPTVHDIAEAAGVSLATVDRVLNDRPGVRQATAERVRAAVAELGYVRDLHAANLARNRQYTFVFMLPASGGEFVESLRVAIDEAGTGGLADRTRIKTVTVPPRDPGAMVRNFAALDPTRIDGLAIMSAETPVTRDAIARLKAHGVAVVSLVSDQPNSERDHFVGVDNRAAGRTAAVLIGRFAGGRRGKVVVVASSMNSREMAERRLGFDSMMQDRFPGLTPLPSIEGHDVPALTERLVREALERHPDAIALYCIGAGVAGFDDARIRADGGPLIRVDHELTANSRRLLEEGLVDAVITQNTGHLARSALRVLRSRCDGAAVIDSQERIRIEIVLKENLT